MVHQLIERDSVKIGNHVHGPSINKREREEEIFRFNRQGPNTMPR